jgi:hypothetical protein
MDKEGNGSLLENNSRKRTIRGNARFVELITISSDEDSETDYDEENGKFSINTSIQSVKKYRK